MSNAPYWWESAGAPKPTEEGKLPRETDILIVGAGLTGLSAARTLAKAGKGVLALDRGIPGIGASSRNGGMIGGGHKHPVKQLQLRHGESVARDLLREVHIDATRFALDAIAEEAIACDFRQTGRFLASWLPRDQEHAVSNLEALRKLIPVEAEPISRAQQHREVATDLYHGGIRYELHGGLNPAKWVAGLREAAIRAGASVRGNMPVTAIERDGAGFLAATPQGAVRAGDVLIATNGYTEGQFGATGRRIFPVPSFIIVTEELGADRVRKLFPNASMIVETRERHCYFRPSPDGTRIVFGGRAALFNASPRFYERQLRGLLRGVFPELGRVAITHRWTGNTGFTFDMTPHVGKIDGLWHAMGYCGNGNAMAPWLGHKAALQIIGDPEGETAFSRIPLPGRWYYRGQPWFLRFADLGFRFRDAAATLANQRASRR